MVEMINTALLRAMSAVAGLKARLSEERGQDLLEYGMVAGLIAIAIVAGFLLFSGDILSLANGIGDCIDFDSSASSPCP